MDGLRAQALDFCQTIDMACVGLVSVMAEFDRQQRYIEDGCPNSVAWLKLHGRMSTALAVQVMSLARQAPRLPEVQRALEVGEIGFQHGAVVAESADKLGAESLLLHQDDLLKKAEFRTADSFRSEVKKVEQQVDAELVRREAEHLHRSRHLNVTTRSDGRVKVDGLLDPLGGAAFKKALEAAMGPRSKDETRSEAQRRADGLADVARHALDGRQFGESGCQRPHVSAYIDEQGMAGVDGLGPVSKEMIELLLCDCGLSINGSAERRTFSPALRRALALKVRTCQFPGCDRPGSWCEGHHIEEYGKRGKTVAENGSLLCPYHHWLMHPGGWKMERREGELVFYKPDRTRYRSVPAPPLVA